MGIYKFTWAKKEKKMVDKINFKNYIPINNKLRKETTKKVDKNIKGDDEQFEEMVRKADVDVKNVKIVPKKANWDLKEELAPKFDQLDKETDLAIERIRKTNNQNVIGESESYEDYSE